MDESTPHTSDGYLTVSGGVQSSDQANLFVQNNGIVYELIDGVLISRVTPPPDVIKYGITKYLNDDVLTRVSKASKTTNALLKSEILSRQIADRRSRLRYTDVAVDYDSNHGERSIDLIEFVSVPIPKLPYGVPDVNSDGEPIAENIESNDQWILLASMFETVSNYNEALDVVTPDMIEELFRHDLLPYDVFIIPDLVAHHGDPVKLLLQISNPEMKHYIYSFDYFRKPIDDAFISSGLFDDVVFIHEGNQDTLKNQPDYPENYLWQLVSSPLFFDVYDDFLEGLRRVDYRKAFNVIKAAWEKKNITPGSDIFDIVFGKAETENDLIEYGKFWFGLIHYFSVEVVVEIFKRFGLDVVRQILATDAKDSFTEYYLNLEDTKLIDDYLHDENSLI